MVPDMQDMNDIAYRIEAGEVLDAEVLGSGRMALRFKNQVVTIAVESIEDAD